MEIEETRRTVLVWPSGQGAGSDDALMGRWTSKLWAQSRQRNS